MVAYGAGTNSKAMLVGLRKHGERPDAITFADTGGEKPHTYEDLWRMQEWCEKVGFPSIEIVRGDMPRQRLDGSLEEECLRLGALPSKAYGFSACSDKWKIDPQERWMRRYMLLHELTLQPLKLIGFHAGETHRAEQSRHHDGRRRFPLIEWGWDYDDCKQAIRAAGLPLPGKSACFFCPSSTKKEILQLREQYPHLLDRALEIERRARAGEGQAPAARCGLGRSLVWAGFLREIDNPRQADLFPNGPEPCDGEACFT